MQIKQYNCDCVVCKNNHDFSIEKKLLNEILNGQVVLFAGAGISTESKLVLKQTFYEQIANELDTHNQSFPELMEKFCKQPNGRLELLKNIRKRFDHINSFSELRQAATRFHNEIGTFFPLKDIVTTNWDTYFEDHCNAVPFISDPDLAFWEAADRRVLKIHGSISNLGSVVATTNDYKSCEKRLNSGLIGAQLKSLLATKTIIFTGYSFTDSDFNSIYKFVRKQMKDLHRQSYIVTPFPQEAAKFSSIGLIPIITDGAYFWRRIKAHAIAEEIMSDDSIYSSAIKLLDLVSFEHKRLHKKIKTADFPEMIFSACYQDGMTHALDRVITLRGSGDYSNSHRLFHVIQNYIEIKKEKLKNGIYEDVAYIEGYLNALFYIESNSFKETQVPLYFGFRATEDMLNLTQYIHYLNQKKSIHKASVLRSKKILSKYTNPTSIVFHHPPWL
ncbi:MAG: SIR2 family protein [Burkholderiaceae bacterium]|nr:SIR2 family protein [Burkholderiaceae bacterium]